MKKSFLFFLGLISFLAPYSQSCEDCYLSSEVYDNIQKSTVKFGEGINADGDNQELFMDVYEAIGDTHSNKPVVVFAFGGGFVQGSKEEIHVVKTCKYFARAGYVAVGIDYRYGFDILGAFPNPVEELMRVFFRAMQDMRASVQYLRYDADSLGNTFNIDPNKIMIGGASAGSITALFVAYCDKEAEFAEMGSISSIDELGGFYSSSSSHTTYDWEVSGVFNIAGALVNSDWIESGDVPLISVHGTDDTTVPIEGGNLNLGFTSIGLEGSRILHQRADSVGLCHYLNELEGKDHPSNGWPDSEYDNLFIHAFPKFKALGTGKSFCCDHSISISEEDTLWVSPGESVILDYELSSATMNEEIQWCETPCGNNSQESTLILEVDSFSLVMILAESPDCISSDHITVLEEIPYVSNHPNFKDEDFSVFPNPVENHLHIESILGFRFSKWSIFDLLGKNVLSGFSSEEKIKIDMKGLSPATYVLKVHSLEGDFLIEEKIIKK